MVRWVIYLAAATLFAFAAATTATAGKGRSQVGKWPTPQRDCTPINGRYGYYGNPWCDTGYRLEDIEVRERNAPAAKRKRVRR